MSRPTRWGLPLLLLLMGAGACELPRDPRDTLSTVRGDTIHVGVSEARPWVIREGEEATGVEPELVRAFARSIDAEVRWVWGSMEEHMEALGLYELDLVIGGVTKASPWRKHVGMTQPYHTTRIIVAGPPGSAPVTEEAMEDAVVAVPEGGPIAGYVREEGGEPRRLKNLATATGLVAAPDWELLELGRDTLGSVLTRSRHVMAAPPGENAFIMALENALHDADVAGLLRRYAGGRP